MVGEFRVSGGRWQEIILSTYSAQVTIHYLQLTTHCSQKNYPHPQKSCRWG